MALTTEQLYRVANFIKDDAVSLEDALGEIGDITPIEEDIADLESRVEILEEGGGGGGIGGSGTAETIAQFTAPGVIGDSSMYYIGGTGVAAEKTTFITNRLHVSVDLNDPPPPSAAQDPALIIVTRGTNCIAHDGGVQSFNQAHYNLDVGAGGAASAIAQAGLFANTATKTGAGSLINTAVAASATGGDVNYSFQGTAGTLRNNEDFLLGTPGTFGDGAAAVGNAVAFHCDVTIDSGQTVALGTNVQTFQVAQVGALSQVGCGMSGGFSYNFLATNNSGAGAGLLIHADTDVSSNQFGGVAFYRGATATNATFRAGIHVGNGGGQFATGDTANALLLWSYDASGTSYGIELATGVNPDVRVRITPAGLTDVLSGLKVTGNLGFYGTTPIAKQTGVAVTAGGIHAALVALGLIAA